METENIPTKQTSRSSLTCRICGDVARGINFDVMTCMSCKSFFRRNALRRMGTLQCSRKFNCEITKEKRSDCAACRLKKCFTFGMKPQLIRSIAQYQLPTPQPLSLLRNDRSTLSFEQWNLLSNIIHVCDEHNFINRMKRLLEEGSSLPIKLRAKPSFALNFAHHCMTSIESLIKQSSHFHSLPVDARRSVIIRNTQVIAGLNTLLILHDTNFISDLNFVLSFTRIHGSDLLKNIVAFFERADRNMTLIKLMIFVIAFSSNSSIIMFDSSDDIGTMSTSIDLIHIQDIYVTILWKYLVYQYGFVEAVLRYSSLIKTVVDMSSPVEEIRKTEMYEKMIGTTLKQIEHSLVIED